ncbi:hypothetical protein TNCV_2335551 [Trichonephila clavipes]|uniref:Uncharacterized protein n=1 Tax=Trichonephila clavipes TaxID=2585209 RepID=A0A8X6SJE0_TRICX|nr:hypothetical protein TNCV_2335551 [Trichonephila clavipes]
MFLVFDDGLERTTRSKKRQPRVGTHIDLPNGRTLCRVSPNGGYKLGGEVQSTVRSHNYKEKHGRKMIGGVIRELARTEHVDSSFQHEFMSSLSMNRYTNSELADIRFIYDLSQQKWMCFCSVVWKKMSNEAASESSSVHLGAQNLAEQGSFRATQDDTPVNSEMWWHEYPSLLLQFGKHPVFYRVGVMHAYMPMEAI